MTAWEVFLCHGNEDVMEVTMEGYPAALEWATREEARRGHSIEGLQATFSLGAPERGRVQFGTNYHYVNFQEVRP